MSEEYYPPVCCSPNPGKYLPESTLYKDVNMLMRTAGSVLPKAAPFAMMSCGWTIVLGELTSIGKGGEQNLMYHPFAYSIFAFCVTFTLVFRTQISYGRYWEGCTQMVFMSTKLCDVVCQCLTFDNIYDPELKNAKLLSTPHWDGESVLYKTGRFRRRMMHLCSLLHATALHTIRFRGCQPKKRKAEAGELLASTKDGRMIVLPTWNTPRIYQPVRTGHRPDPPPKWQVLSLPVLGGVSQDERKLLEPCEDKLNLILSWTVQEITGRKKEGGLRVEPPIITRAFQELSNGMLGFNQAFKVVERPFPFCYTQLLFVLLIIHSSLLPLLLVAFTKNTWLAALIDFMVVLMFFSLEICSREIENCFGIGTNCLDLCEFQSQYNVWIMSLLTDVKRPQPLKQIVGLAKEWDVQEPDLFLKSSGLTSAPASMGPPSAASAVPNADLGSTGVVAPLRVTGMYDELGGRMLRGIRLTQEDSVVTATYANDNSVRGFIVGNRLVSVRFGDQFMNAMVTASGDIEWENKVIWKRNLDLQY